MPENLKKLNEDISDISTWLEFDRTPWLIAGPCSAESAEQVLSTARSLTRSPNVKAFRAGVWKPRTRPNTFEGVGKVGLDWLRAVKAETSLLTTTEVANARHVELSLLGPWDTDLERRRYSYQTALAANLLGKAAGDTVTLKLDGNEADYTIESLDVAEF